MFFLIIIVLFAVFGIMLALVRALLAGFVFAIIAVLLLVMYFATSASAAPLTMRDCEDLSPVVYSIATDRDKGMTLPQTFDKIQQVSRDFPNSWDAGTTQLWRDIAVKVYATPNAPAYQVKRSFLLYCGQIAQQAAR